MRFIECRGSAREMGRQYGEQAGDLVRRDLELRFGGGKVDGARKAAFGARARAVIGRFHPELLEELEGLAEASGADSDLVLLANQVDTFDEEAERCTPMILRDAPEGPVIAKNNDGPPHEAYPFVVRKCEPAGGIPFLQVTYAGWLNGLDALNAEGLANTHGSVGSVFDKSGDRIDIRLRASALMRTCRTTEGFMEGLREVPLTGKGFSIAVGDGGGDTVMLDAAVPFVASRSRGVRFAYSTNLYESPGLERADRRGAGKRPICEYRRGYLRWIEQERPPGTLADIQALLASEEPWAPCRNGGPHQSVTFWSMIALPRDGRLLVAEGLPSGNAYVEYTL